MLKAVRIITLICDRCHSDMASFRFRRHQGRLLELKSLGELLFRPAGARLNHPSNPGLAPWAAFCRRFAAQNTTSLRSVDSREPALSLSNGRLSLRNS
jgi:hypothetical protein